MEFLHQCLQVTNLDKSVEFYKEVLGLSFSRRIEMIERNQVAVFLKDSTDKERLELNSNNELVCLEISTQTHLAFEVENFENIYKKHSDLGIVIDILVPGKIYFIKDLDGHVIEILDKYRNNKRK